MNKGSGRNALQSEVIAIGGVEEVTGTKIIVKVKLSNGLDFNIQVDSGKAQGLSEYKNKSNDRFDIYTKLVNAIIATHGHVDHVGSIPMEYARGYNGNIYMTDFTAMMTGAVLDDGYKIDLENQKNELQKNNRLIKKYKDARYILEEHGRYSELKETLVKLGFKLKHGLGQTQIKTKNTKGNKFVLHDLDPDVANKWVLDAFELVSKNGVKYRSDLEKEIRSQVPGVGYNKTHVEQAKKHIIGVKYNQDNTLYKRGDDHVYFTMLNAGHSLGSAQIIITHEIRGNVVKRFLFTGDLGRINDPFVLAKPTLISEYAKEFKKPLHFNFISTESTYGNKIHANTIEEGVNKFYEICNEAPGNIIGPLFAYQRTPDISYVSHKGIDSGKIQNFGHGDVYIEGGLSDKYLKYFAKYDTAGLMNKGYEDAYKYVLEKQSLPDGASTNNKIIYPSGGMMQGGFSTNYIQYLDDPSYTFVFFGYQVPGTKGHEVVNNPKKYKAKIHSISFSGHADQSDLKSYFDDIQKNYSMGEKTTVMIQHGDTDAKNSLAKILQDEHEFSLTKNNIRIPKITGESRKI